MTLIRPRSHAFSLIELLVVIGIITILIGILIPTVQSIRQAAWGADSKNTLSQISGAITRYYQDHNAYPGPLSNEQLKQAEIDSTNVIIGGTAWADGNVTMTENLTLALLGGLRPVGTAVGYFKDDTLQARGPQSLNTANPKRFPAYITASDKMLSFGKMSDPDPDNQNVQPGMNDSIIPEFLDGWPIGDQLPIIYVRAKAGATGIMDIKTNNMQYDWGYIRPYLRAGKDGLQNQTNQNSTTLTASTTITDKPMDNAGVYFQHPSVPTTPREKDRFVLIAAGKDRIYGTSDDIASWGDR